MPGQKAQKLQHVAPVGFERLRRIAPLVAEVRQTAYRVTEAAGLARFTILEKRDM